MKDTLEPHTRKTLEHIGAEIQVRQDELKQLLECRRTLCELYGIPAELPLPKELPMKGDKPAKRGPYKTKTAREDARPTDVKKSEGGGTRAPRAAKAAAVAPRSYESLSTDKPDTVSGAMKQVARKLKTFTVSALLAEVGADADWKKLLDAGNPTSPYSSVAYWAETGKLKKEGDGKDAVYTVVDL